MRCWSLTDGSIQEIGEWSLANRHVDRLLVSTRLDQDAKPSRLLAPNVSESIDRIFGDLVLSQFETQAWPGTELAGHLGRVFIIEFNERVLKRMMEAENLLANWTQWNEPALPEDVCLFREGDEWPVLVSVTHENSAWVLSDSPVGLRGIEETSFSSNDLLIPRDPLFVQRGK
jgi:hypothetical protein